MPLSVSPRYFGVTPLLPWLVLLLLGFVSTQAHALAPSSSSSPSPAPVLSDASAFRVVSAARKRAEALRTQGTEEDRAYLANPKKLPWAKEQRRAEIQRKAEKAEAKFHEKHGELVVPTYPPPPSPPPVASAPPPPAPPPTPPRCFTTACRVLVPVMEVYQKYIGKISAYAQEAEYKALLVRKRHDLKKARRGTQKGVRGILYVGMHACDFVGACMHDFPSMPVHGLEPFDIDRNRLSDHCLHIMEQKAGVTVAPLSRKLAMKVWDSREQRRRPRSRGLARCPRSLPRTHAHSHAHAHPKNRKNVGVSSSSRMCSSASRCR